MKEIVVSICPVKNKIYVFLKKFVTFLEVLILSNQIFFVIQYINNYTGLFRVIYLISNSYTYKS